MAARVDAGGSSDPSAVRAWREFDFHPSVSLFAAIPVIVAALDDECPCATSNCRATA